jgi:hypothetical protein
MYKEGKNLIPLGTIATTTAWPATYSGGKEKKMLGKKELACKNYKGKY